jgi:hypothetical protein
MGWGHALLRATLIGTVLQLTMVVGGHYDARVARLFAVLGLLISLAAGFFFARRAGIGRTGSILGGLGSGAVCALIAIVESFVLGDVPVWVVLFGTGGSAVTGALGGWLGWFSRRR